MAPTFLVVGATGNTGQSVVETLSSELKNSSAFSNYSILAQTRSASSATAQRLAKLPNVSIVEKPWIEITPEWLREHEVSRAFVASHNEPVQFAEESSFLVAALRAGVEYVVRISTTAANVRADCDAYYPRTHWAIEAMLSSPEFKALQWTSLQPNVFTTFWLAPAAGLVKNYRETGKQETLRLMASEDAPVGVVEPSDVGGFAARLLLTKDVQKHNGAKYVMNGPEDITGKQVVEMVEKAIGEPVKDVVFKDMSFLDAYVEAEGRKDVKTVMRSIAYAPVTAWEGKCTASTTSKEVLEIAPPKHSPTAVFEALLKE